MLKWDDNQLRVIEAEPEARLLVEAGPGTGKTAVACGRVACLLRDWEVQPGNILLLSFTRTAVAELRDRIATFVGNEHLAAAVRITTLDSATWHLLYGFDRDASKLFGSYDANIEAVLERLESRDQDLLEHLERYQHVIIDEAQDLTSVRARLAIALIRALSDDCGVTIFADPFQAIYGFTAEEDEEKGEPARTFLDLLREDGVARFRGVELRTLYRAGNGKVAALMRSLREVLEQDHHDDKVIHAELRSRLTDLASPLSLDRRDLPRAVRGRSDILILYRRRAEVLLTSSILCSEEVPHRLRLSGLPVCIQPWVARVFFDCREDRMHVDEFHERWNGRGCTALSGGLSADDAWERLDRVVRIRDSVIDVKQLRQRLARARPPVEVCMPDCGLHGPILGTIHASKGREADTVYLFVPDDRPDEGADEESRVLYVGATRARNSLCVTSPGRVYAQRLESSGRAFALDRGGRAASMELGRAGDLDEAATVSRRLNPDKEIVLRGQELLAENAGCIMEMHAVSERDWDYRFRIRQSAAPEDLWLGEFATEVNRDMFTVIKMTGHHLRPPDVVKHIFSIGARTVVLGHDNPALSDLHFPFRISGFFLVPIVRAWTKVYFRFKKKKW